MRGRWEKRGKRKEGLCEWEWCFFFSLGVVVCGKKKHFCGEKEVEEDRENQEKMGLATKMRREKREKRGGGMGLCK